MQKSTIDYVFLYDDHIINGIKGKEKYEKLLERAYKIYDIFKSKLNKEDLKLFEEYADCEEGMECAITDLYFKEGLKLGMRLAAECFLDI